MFPVPDTTAHDSYKVLFVFVYFKFKIRLVCQLRYQGIQRFIRFVCQLVYFFKKSQKCEFLRSFFYKKFSKKVQRCSCQQAYMPGVKSLVFLTRDLSPKIPRSLVILNQIPRVFKFKQISQNDKNLHYFSSKDEEYLIFSYLISLILTVFQEFIKIIHKFLCENCGKTQKINTKPSKSLDPSYFW